MNQGFLANVLEGLRLLVTFDADVWDVIGVSFTVSSQALLLALPGAICIGFLLATTRFPGRWICVSLFQTLQAVPTVVVGLLVYLLLYRQGPLGDLRWLFSQPAMIMAQFMLAFPLLVSLCYGAFASADWRAWETARTLGAGKFRAFLVLCHELRAPLWVAVISGFSRVITEVGASMLVGGNIQHVTRNIPTAIALETSKGSFAQAIALGTVLLLLALILNFTVGSLRHQRDSLARG
ncbi:ABC transporter permease [Ferrimonas lipolytica]|uniref:ABC transporter permease n=1 Tax=Ferrimonas lipolytica TaxID=2724191 RepID=A0A6H1UG40_9GAMM|nr:ABC transporter permease [Ferrimonas lipolytica]QIZ78014.1 ABC transporter permease [Ferrimonas lipolytica]